MQLTDFIPTIAAHLHMAPSDLLTLLITIGTIANLIARWIPDDATGWRGKVRKVAAVAGVYLPSRITTAPDGTPVTVNTVASAAYKTPPIPAKVQEENHNG